MSKEKICNSSIGNCGVWFKHAIIIGLSIVGIGFMNGAAHAASIHHKRKHRISDAESRSHERLFDRKSINCMATNVFYESRGDTVESQMMVALVTANRVMDRRRSTCSIVYSPHQFSWTDDRHRHIHWNKLEVKAWDRALLISKVIYAALKDGTLNKIDFTHGATHYHTKDVDPSWDDKLSYLGIAGKHMYYE